MEEKKTIWRPLLSKVLSDNEAERKFFSLYFLFAFQRYSLKFRFQILINQKDVNKVSKLFCHLKIKILYLR